MTLSNSRQNAHLCCLCLELIKEWRRKFEGGSVKCLLDIKKDNTLIDMFTAVFKWFVIESFKVQRFWYYLYWTCYLLKYVNCKTMASLDELWRQKIVHTVYVRKPSEAKELLRNCIFCYCEHCLQCRAVQIYFFIL